MGFILKLQPRRSKQEIDYPQRALDLRSSGGRICSPGGVTGFLRGWLWDSETQWPYTEPPWSTLTALDLNRGTKAWQVPLGIVDALAAKGIKDTGAPSIGGGIVTAGGLVFIGASNDRRFRAFDSATGKELWVGKIDGSAHAVPMTYLGRKTGKQFVVIAAGGGNKYSRHFSDALVAFALP